MAPSAESKVSPKATRAAFQYPSVPKPPLDRKTVAFAVNYEPSMVDHFQKHSQRSRVGFSTDSTQSESSPNFSTGSSTGSTASSARPSSASSTKSVRVPAMREAASSSENVPPTNINSKASRRSSREQKQRSVNMTVSRVRYDMEMVPLVERNALFYETVNTWPPKHSMGGKKRSAPSTPPFVNSVVWKPDKRKDWEDSVSEMTAVCTSAALRKYNPSDKKPFAPPLSREYIRDRVDIDDPLRGYQIRHETGGWLQGFVLWTNFTTWTHFFTWDSHHEQSGLADTQWNKDLDGSLGRELEALPREGDPTDSGFVFQNVAEIALLGGLGCGEMLLRMALQEIRQHSQYQYVVLQATNGSRSFYERFGFTRVGAICRYGTNGTNKGVPTFAVPTLETPIQGYRHWTHANESQQSLDLHGGPSYMMCLKLPTTADGSTLLQRILKDYTIAGKPPIEALGAASTPAPKRRFKGGKLLSPPPGLPPLTTSKPALTPDALSALESSSSKRVFYPELAASSDQTPPPTKRRKVSKDAADLQTPMTNPNQPYDWYNAPPQQKPSATRKPRSTPKKKKTSKPAVAASPTPPIEHNQAAPSESIQVVNKATLCKQKVKSYPRDRPHFFNKVVERKGAGGQGTFYFVLHYSEPNQQLVLCPMAPKGVLSGKRQGRPRYQCVLEPTSSNWVTGSTSHYDAVPAFMVMKTPIISQEAWDVMGEP